LPSFDGRYPVVGSWIVNGHACGVGIREDDGLITRNTSRFLPHLFRKSAAAKPPSMNPKGQEDRAAGIRPSTGINDPLWDPWLDR
jgi:Glutathionylspermidine synthase preATP-grasp